LHQNDVALVVHGTRLIADQPGRGFAMTLRTDERKTAKLTLMLPPSERAWLEQEAEQVGIDLSSYVRMVFKQARVQQSPQHEAA
jgi:hypothetical protein